MATWVVGLCSAFGRFAAALGLTSPEGEPPSEARADPSFDETVEALRRLQSDVEALGIPNVEGGAALASGVVAGMGRSMAALERAGGPADLIAALIGAPPGTSGFSAIAYPFGLLIFLGGAGESAEVAVYLDDPVRDVVVARLSRLLGRRPDVANVRFESKAQACRRFKELFADQQALVENVDCDALPASFRVRLTPGASGPSVHDALIDENGVDTVVITPVLGEFLATSVFTQGQLHELDPVRAEAARHSECTSLPPFAVWAPT
jgi:hypothetical protein